MDGDTMALPMDEALLDRFLQEKDEGAFADLVGRHGPMVRATCRRILGDGPDADDAFQAVFVVLARKAASISRRDLLGPWLHTVSVRAATRARLQKERRWSRERTVTVMPEPPSTPECEPSDWLPLLDDALQSLPEKYRRALILCDLQGQLRTEAAARLGIAEGTLSSRLARGRVLLRRRLLQRGAAVSVVALAAWLASPALAGVPQGLIASTIQAAHGGAMSAPVAAISEGVLQAMRFAKIKLLCAVVLGVVLVTGGVAVGVLAFAGAAAVQAKSDKDALQGTWKVVLVKENGNEKNDAEADMIKKGRFVFKGDKVIARGECDFKVDPSKKPKEFDMIPLEGPPQEKGQTFKGIYELKGDDLTMVFRNPGGDRPKSLDDNPPDGVTMYLQLKRVKD
jgi:RNA polymerase sigma factor (sigma-70 family)